MGQKGTSRANIQNQYETVGHENHEQIVILNSCESFLIKWPPWKTKRYVIPVPALSSSPRPRQFDKINFHTTTEGITNWRENSQSLTRIQRRGQRNHVPFSFIHHHHPGTLSCSQGWASVLKLIHGFIRKREEGCSAKSVHTLTKHKTTALGLKEIPQQWLMNIYCFVTVSTSHQGGSEEGKKGATNVLE